MKFISELLILFVIFLYCGIEGTNRDEDDCWNEKSTSCFIRIEIHNWPAKEKNYTTKLNCIDVGNMLLETNINNPVNVSLNGCHMRLDIETFGLEYTDLCAKINYLTIEKFQKDYFRLSFCPDQQENQLHQLVLKKNHFGTIDSKSFMGFFKNIENLFLFDNAIMFLEHGAFDGMPFLNTLFIQNDQTLSLDGNSIINSKIKHLTLVELRNVHPNIFFNLPKNLEHLYVSNVDGFANADILLENSFKLNEISIENSNVMTFILNDKYSSVSLLNLRGNKMRTLKIPENSNIMHLDLSYNSLSFWPSTFPKIIPNLRYLNLRGNQIKYLSVGQISSMSRNLDLIDIRFNELFALRDIPKDAIDLTLRFQIDSNPLNCKWLLHLGDSYPSMFRLLKYEKFISKINVNGLECQMGEEIEDYIFNNGSNIFTTETNIVQEDQLDLHLYNKSSSTGLQSYISTDAANFKRNQKIEALIIIFLLPLGISILFLMLYLWLHCHKIFNYSFYTCLQTNADEDGCKPELKLNTNDGYEIPLQSVSAKREVCVIPPPEISAKIYEEIPELRSNHRKKSLAKIY